MEHNISSKMPASSLAWSFRVDGLSVPQSHMLGNVGFRASAHASYHSTGAGAGVMHVGGAVDKVTGLHGALSAGGNATLKFSHMKHGSAAAKALLTHGHTVAHTHVTVHSAALHADPTALATAASKGHAFLSHHPAMAKLGVQAGAKIGLTSKTIWWSVVLGKVALWFAVALAVFLVLSILVVIVVVIARFFRQTDKNYCTSYGDDEDDKAVKLVKMNVGRYSPRRDYFPSVDYADNFSSWDGAANSSSYYGGGGAFSAFGDIGGAITGIGGLIPW